MISVITILGLTAASALSQSAATSTALAPDSVANDSINLQWKDLDDFVIEVKKDIVKSDGSKVTYDMEADKTSKGQTLLDALRKVPLVTVDGQDNIQINGSSNFKIFVNGKEEPMLEANYSTIFKSMPADAYNKIEVITEPGAKYDAEGTGGILNLISEKKQKNDGYSGAVNISASNRQAVIGGYGAGKINNFSIDGNIYYVNNRFNNQKQNSTSRTYDYKSDDNYLKERTGTQNFGFDYIGGALNASWDPNENNLFTLGANVTYIDAGVKDMTSSTRNFNRQGILTSAMNQNFDGFMKQFSLSANTSYQHTFGARGHNLILTYMFNYGRNPLHIWAENENEKDYFLPYVWSANLMNNYTREHTVQADYVNPFGGEKHTLETGGKMIIRRNSSYSFQEFGNDRNNLTASPANDVMMNQNQNIYALYASYSGHFGKWSAKAGVRYEHSDMGTEKLNDGREKFWTGLDDVVPNAAITYSFSPASNLRLAYQMRISRPSLSQVSPFQMSIMEGFVQEGNPDLTSERNNKISITYTNFARVLGGNIALSYSHTNNAIENYSYLENGIDYSTYANVGTKQVVALNGFLNVNLNSKMSFSVNGRIQYKHLTSPSLGYKNHGFSGNWGANWNYTGPADVKFSVYGGQSIHDINLTGYSNGWYYYGLGINRDFLKDKTLNIGITASNFFTAYSSYKSYTFAKDYKSVNNWRNEHWSVGVNISWRFGNLKSTTKKTAVQINNDDTATGSSSKGGGGGISL